MVSEDHSTRPCPYDTQTSFGIASSKTLWDLSILLHRGTSVILPRMYSAVLLVILCLTATVSHADQPQSSIPSVYKTHGNTSSRMQALRKKQALLASSQEALVVTERKYLKSDWCKTQSLRQTVSEEGCVSRTVINRFCYGQCNSFYIPRHIKDQESFQSCAFCQPQKFTMLTVELDCPELQPTFRHHKIQRVKQCRCISISLTKPSEW